MVGTGRLERDFISFISAIIKMLLNHKTHDKWEETENNSENVVTSEEDSQLIALL